MSWDFDVLGQFKYLKSKGDLSVKYIEDSLLLGEAFEICFKNIRATVALLQELRFTIHPEMSVLVPMQQTIFLGFMITLTEEKKIFLNWDSLYARQNSHYEAWSYKKKKNKKIKAYRKLF